MATTNLVQRAQRNGYNAIVLTADRSRFGRREADIKKKMIVPQRKNLEIFLSTEVVSVVHVVRGRIPVLVDGGIQSGTYVFKAYYGPRVALLPYYNSAMASGHAPYPYMWGAPQVAVIFSDQEFRPSLCLRTMILVLVQ